MVLAVLASLLLWSMTQKRVIESRPELISNIPISTPSPQGRTYTYTDKELHQFFSLHISKIINDFATGQYQVSPIQDEYTRLSMALSKKNGRPLSVSLAAFYDPASKDVLAHTSGISGEDITLVIPALKDAYEELRASKPGGEQVFEVLLVSAFIHEVQHIGYGHAAGKSKEELFTSETATWALTCSMVLEKFLARGYQLDTGNTIVYNGWKKCGNDATCFRRFMEEVAYAPANLLFDASGKRY